MFKKWKAKIKISRNDQEFRNGYDYAAGALLRKETTPLSIENHYYNERTHFDKGCDAAMNELIRLNVVFDDRS